jgi:hypothetical protein
MMFKQTNKQLKLRPLVLAIGGVLAVSYGGSAAALSGGSYSTTTISTTDSIAPNDTFVNNAGTYQTWYSYQTSSSGCGYRGQYACYTNRLGTFNGAGELTV